MTYEQLQMNGLPSAESTEKKSRLYRQDFRASRTALQEKVAVIVTVVTCGEKLQECSEKSDRPGSSVRIRLVYLQGKISDSSDEYSMTLPRWGIRSAGEYGELVTSERRTEGIGCSLSQTETFPTPCASEAWTSELKSTQQKEGSRHSVTLSNYVETFPTPLSSDAIRMRYSEESLRKVGMRRTNGDYVLAGCNLAEYIAVHPGQRSGGKLNPTWVEWLMGFPIGWTDLNVLETQ